MAKKKAVDLTSEIQAALPAKRPTKQWIDGLPEEARKALLKFRDDKQSDVCTHSCAQMAEFAFKKYPGLIPIKQKSLEDWFARRV